MGINYFRGHRFRSRVFLDIGKPIVPSAELIEQYCTGGAASREACGELMHQIRMGLDTVTVEADNFNDLQFIRGMRRLYSNDAVLLSANERFRMTKAFSACYERDKEDEGVKKMYQSVLNYRHLLDTYKVTDHSVATAATADSSNLLIETGQELVWCAVRIVVFFIISVPGLVASWPILLIVRLVASSKAREAKKHSSVKIAGRDVMATWKVLMSLVVTPLVHVLYTTVCYFYFGEPHAVAWFFIMPFFALGSIKAFEQVKSIFKQFLPLLMATFKKTMDVGGDLTARRVRLQDEARILVNRLGWDAEFKGTKLYRSFVSEFSWEEDIESSL